MELATGAAMELMHAIMFVTSVVAAVASLMVLWRMGRPALPVVRPVDEARLAQVVAEAYRVAEQMGALNAKNGRKVSGADKQREAMQYAKRRITEMNLTADLSVIAQRIEALVQENKK